MSANNVRITAAHVGFGAFLIGFLLVGQVDQAWLGHASPGSKPPTRSELSRQPWPPLTTTYVLAGSFVGLITAIRFKERNLRTATSRPPIRGWRRVGHSVSWAARLLIFVFAVCMGGMLWAMSIADASRWPGWPAGGLTGVIMVVGLLSYAALATYWGSRLFRLFQYESRGNANPKLPTSESPSPLGVWDQELDR